MNDRQKKSGWNIFFEELTLLIIIADLVIIILIIREYFHLTFGWNSPELGVLLFVFWLILLLLPTNSKDNNE